MKVLGKQIFFSIKTHSRALFKPPLFYTSTLIDYYKDFQYMPPFLFSSASTNQKFQTLLTDIQANKIRINTEDDLSKFLEIFKKTTTRDPALYQQIAKQMAVFFEKPGANIIAFLEPLLTCATEKPDFIAIGKETFLNSLVGYFSKFEINSYNVNQAAGLAHALLLYETGYKEIYEFLQNPRLDSQLNRELMNVLFSKFNKFKENTNSLNESFLVELLQSYFIVMRAFLKVPEYKAFFYSVNKLIYKNLKGFSTSQLTTLAILFQSNHIVHKKFWDSLEEEVHFRINEWNLSHLMKVCDCFMSVKEGSLNFFDEIQKFFMNNIDCINLEEIPSFIQILVQDEKILDPFLSQLEAKILINFEAFDVNQLSRILWCFALRKRLNDDLYKRIENKLSQNFDELLPFETVLALYAIKYSKNQSKLLESAKEMIPKIIAECNADHEVVMGLLFTYCDTLKSEKFYAELQRAVEIMIYQCTPVVFIDFMRLCVQIHKNKENLFEKELYDKIKIRYRELEIQYRDEEKMEVKEMFKYLNII